MAFGAAEARCQKSLNQLPGGRVADDQAAEADHIQVIVLDALVRRKRFMNQARAHTRHLVGGDRGAHAAAANGDAAIYRPGGNCACQWDNKIWIVIVRLRLGVSEIADAMSALAQQPDQMLLQGKATMVRGDSDPQRLRQLGWAGVDHRTGAPFRVPDFRSPL